MRSRWMGGSPAGGRGTRFFFFAMILAGSSLGAAAQAPPEDGGEAAAAGRLRVVSQPSGAIVTLAGEHRWRGTTPWEVDRGLTGSYEVTARLRGFEQWKRDIDLKSGENRELSIRLTPKRAWKAAARSILIPGWGQNYGERHGKGRAFLLGAAAGGIAWFWTNEIYQDRVDDYRSAREDYFSEDRWEELAALKARSDRAERRADQAYDHRTIAMAATAGIYAVSVIDALFFFPEPSEGSFTDLTLWEDGGARLALSPRGIAGLAISLDLATAKGGAR